MLSRLNTFKAEWTCRFTADVVRRILQMNDIYEFAVTPAWGPPVWADIIRQFTSVKFGPCIMSQLERLELPNFLYPDEQEELDW